MAHLNKLSKAGNFLNCLLDWLISGSRYMLTAVPMWIILGELGSRYRKLDYVIV